MKGSGNSEFNGLTGAVFLGHADGEGDLRFLSGDNDLARAVEVGHVDIGSSG